MVRVEVGKLTGDSIVAHFRTAQQTRNRLLEVAEDHDSIVLDLSAAEWFTPTFLTPISVTYNQLTENGTKINIQYPDYGTTSYLEQIRFPSGTAEPSENYKNHLPLCLMNTGLDEDVIEIVGSKVRELLTERFYSDYEKIHWIHYPISEVIDNVDYHSGCDFGALLVQHYPKKEALDICIADDGVSIPGSYDDYGIEFEDDETAIRMAAEEGVSTRPETGLERGYGLRTTVEMICDGLNGQVMLSSRQATIFRNRNAASKTILSDFRWSGTVFAARLNMPEEEFNYLDYMTPD